MMSYFKTFIGVFIILAISRFIPHPPNFTSLIALSFYVPAFFGLRHLPIVLISFVLTDVIIGFHQVSMFTWGSVVLIGLLSGSFLKNIYTRILGSLLGACIFFLVTNFGVWSLGVYGYSLNGVILSYTMAIPFFVYNIISTLVFSTIIESLIKFNFLKINKIKNNFNV